MTDEKPYSLADMERDALADLREPTMTKVTSWAFRAGRCAGLRVIKDRALKRLEDEEMTVRLRASGMPSDGARELVMENAPGQLAMYKAEMALAEAVAAEEAAKTILQLLQRPRKPAAEPAKAVAMSKRV